MFIHLVRPANEPIHPSHLTAVLAVTSCAAAEEGVYGLVIVTKKNPAPPIVGRKDPIYPSQMPQDQWRSLSRRERTVRFDTPNMVSFSVINLIKFHSANRIAFRLNASDDVPVQRCFSLTQVNT